jgi:nucleotide-binding universal stress UspA family protein
MSEFRKLVVPYDFSKHAETALATAVDFANRVSADLLLLHVVQAPDLAFPAVEFGGSPPPLPSLDVQNGALEALEKVASGVKLTKGSVTPHVVEGLAADREITDFAERMHADLIVMGTHGRTGVAHVFLGSVAERTLRRASCPVLTVPPPAEDRED